MVTDDQGSQRHDAGLLARLARDTRGNTLALMAAALIPVAAIAGSAVDMGRLYVVKVRLQQACDAGVLAGRKFLDTDAAATTIDDNARDKARTFFTNNFRTGWFETTDVSFTPSKTSDTQVAGTANATVPMSVMKMFGMAPVPITVTCKARYDVADADIMFVLDTTGSMGCLASDNESTCTSYATGKQQSNADGTYSVVEKNGSRISRVRDAVLLFYDTVTKLADPTTHFRYGFTPYSATANVGYLLPRSYIADKASYQSRTQLADVNNGNPVNSTQQLKQADCLALNGKTAYSTSGSYYNATRTTATWTPPGGNNTTANGTCTISRQAVRANFRYAQVADVDTSDYADGEVVPNPADPNGANSAVWPGCVEERSTTSNTTTFSTTNPPPDLDVDAAPTGGSTDKWRPLWLDVEFWRGNVTSEDTQAVRTPATRANATAWYYNDIPCPKRAQGLKTMSRDDIKAYVYAADFRPFGVTYHDVGMTWGTRLLSPQGMFASSTTAWPGRQPPNRFIIFLTDGDMQTSLTAYAAHGMEQFDKRVVGAGTMTAANQETMHNARFLAACSIAKAKNMKVFVIAYAAALTTQMSNCASSGQAYAAPTDDKLKEVFTTIAQQVAMLRIDE